MKKFDTKVQYLKYKVLREVAKFAWEDTLLSHISDIPEMIIPGPQATMRCCIYKERAILSKRIKLAMGGDNNNPNIIEVINIACDECPIGGYEVTNACRGCLAHRCKHVCKQKAISFDMNKKAYIDKSKCIECGACSKVCPYSAIIHHRQPCEKACKVQAISMNEYKDALIDNNKCISCGACVYQCPFGAIMDKSFIIDAINIIKNSENNIKYKVFAVVAPSIASQFIHAKLGQVINGIKKLGAHSVIEAASGADMVALSESKELIKNGFLTSSCCPAFTKYIKQNFPNLAPYISDNLSPMATISKYLKDLEPNCKIIFIGPCTAKKAEIKLDNVKKYVDTVITFEELQALFDSKNIDITSLSEDSLSEASYFGRIFARSGGVCEAIDQAIKEQNLSDFKFNPIVCSGIEECKIALLKKEKNILEENFIEGMACEGGCIGGAGCLTHGDINKNKIEKYAKDSSRKSLL